MINIFSQEKGKLEGKVFDSKTNEPLIGVSIKLKGTYYGAATNIDGSFSIQNINVGEYIIEANSIGYKTSQYTGIKIFADKSTSLDIKLIETILSLDKEVVVIGEKPLFDIEEASSIRTITADEIRAAPVMGIQDIVSKQVGVTKTAEGIYIRGARSYETSYLVDGVSAKDPLAGTGFGIEVNPLSMKEIEVITGGIGAEYSSTAGVISVTTLSGTDEFQFSSSYKRDNINSNSKNLSNFNQDQIDLSFSGPIFSDKFTFYSSFSGFVSDEFTQSPANQLFSSIANGKNFAPRQDNRLNGLIKLTFQESGSKYEVTYRRSIKINQNTRMLQMGGNDVVLSPGYQYAFALQPDNANTYTHDANLLSFKYSVSIDAKSFFDFQVSRLFTRLRADANGREFRPDSFTTIFDPQSIITNPISYWKYSLQDSVMYVIISDPTIAGLYNNGGIATLWHDHFAEEITLKGDYSLQLNNENKLKTGVEIKFQEYQWIDVNRPWIGAPIKVGDLSRSLGESFDIWHVWPSQGGAYIQDQINYNGLIAFIGLRFQYWMPGKFIENVVGDSESISKKILTDKIVDEFYASTFSIFDRRIKGRLMPRLKVSFPVSDNQVLFFNYGHSVDWPNAYQVYSGLDITRIDRSPLSRIGNPALEPETTVEYEIGLKNQFNINDVLTLTAFSKDKFDYVVRRYLYELDKTTYINEDYARINGIEFTYLRRFSQNWQTTFMFSYQIAKGKSNSAEASFFRFTDEQTTKEKYLAWDRPLQIRLTSNLRLDDEFEFPEFLQFLYSTRIFTQANFQSGKRYTPYIKTGYDYNLKRDLYREDLSREYQSIGENWFWVDLSIQKNLEFLKREIMFSLEVTNLFNNKNSTIINPLTGRAYELGDLTPFRDPTKPHPEDTGLPPFDPARYLEQRHIVFGLTLKL
ncbi:MAG: TonB-dependent receptor [Bacteroidetes bacterium]|nr:TonB-dependent receptor [Bacteroidota bacterium]